MTSAKIFWFLRDFVPEYYHAKYDCNWTSNKGETEGVPPQAYMVPKDPSLNRVKTGFHAAVPHKSGFYVTRLSKRTFNTEKVQF